jgi:hypothetical protein
MRFLPSIYDNDATIIGKLNSYNKYIESKAAGTTATPGAMQTYQGQTTQNPTAPIQNRPQEIPGSWGKATVVGE